MNRTGCSLARKLYYELRKDLRIEMKTDGQSDVILCKLNMEIPLSSKS